MPAASATSSPRDLLPARARVVSTVRRWIEQGQLVDGDPFPSERSLADRLQVARGTVRSAFDELRDEGLMGDLNGARVVRAAGQTSSQSTLIDQSIAVATRSIGPQITDRIESPGWELFIERGALDAVFDAGLHGICLHPERLGSGEGLQRLIAGRPAGVILGRHALEHPDGPGMVAAFQEAGIPLVVYGNGINTRQLDRVYSDHAAGSAMLTEHLVKKGCRRILRVWPSFGKPPYWLVDRDRGHEKAMQAAGLEPLEPLLLDTAFAHTEGRADRFSLNQRAMAGYLLPLLSDPARRPDALMLASDGSLCWVDAAVRLFGLEPGRDIQIVGYDNYFTDLVDQGIHAATPAATVDKRNPEIGQQMVRLLIDRIEGRLGEEPQARVVEPGLVVSGG